ncbi:SGNH/GDSL hydrolase family protein [Clostridiaceae bacterium 68-1-5]|uniref:SGNH/GDSL hydrolase family protein n=1 Tax=Suipraeoptans intestinalis TaxID=2606628 RepID=A0A6N7UZX3_9FIRM|nr:SGNH/GDSL hydrolase family protein [Suipraeoptans intestinalis]MSR93430.1 SGNH/GDSL hydrolase family protein [Suipraeoptans intestinalis]
MRDFKKIGKKIGKPLLFFAILFLMLEGVSRKLEAISLKDEKLVQGRNKSLVRIKKEPKDTVDVLVLGDSLSYSAISPMEIWDEEGIPTFVCGQAGQKVQETYYLLKTALETQSPKIVMLEANIMFRGGPGLSAIKESIEEWGNNHISILRFHDVWKACLINKEYPDHSFKGYSFRTKIRPYRGGSYMTQTEESAEFPDVVLKTMVDIEQLCREHGARLVLVGTPSPANYNFRRHNAIAGYAAEHGLTFLDMNLQTQELGIDWKKDSLDGGDHLNITGAKKVSRFLGKYLKENFSLKDRREDQVYVEWNEKLKEYQERERKVVTKMEKHGIDVDDSVGKP